MTSIKFTFFSVVMFCSEVSEGYTAYIFRLPGVLSETSGKMNRTARFKTTEDPHLNRSRRDNINIYVKFTILEDLRRNL